MTETQVIAVRSDLDIEADIQHLFAHYPPLAHDRHRIKVNVQEGVVTLVGYVKAPVSRHYALKNIPNVDGVKALKADNFYDDEMIRLEAGRKVPSGVQVIVEYGAIILAGSLPTGTTADVLVQVMSKVPGVHKVVVAFK